MNFKAGGQAVVLVITISNLRCLLYFKISYLGTDAVPEILRWKQVKLVVAIYLMLLRRLLKVVISKLMCLLHMSIRFGLLIYKVRID